MRSQVGALLQGFPHGLTAAPPAVLSVLAPFAEAQYPLPETADSPRTLLRIGAAAGVWARREGATLLHGHGLRWLPLFAAASWRARLPLVVTLHNLVPEQMPRNTEIVLRLLLSRAHRIIAVSEAVAQSARAAGLGTGRLVVVHNGVDLRRFDAENTISRAAAVRAELEINDTAPVALCVARLAPEKDVGYFLEAAALIKNLLPHARFLIAGDGPLRPTLERQIPLLGLQNRAFLLGERRDIPALLRAADCFCLPSRQEGLGIAVLEAMASGLPVAATRVGGVPEIVDESKTGLLVPPRDPQALAGALAALLADPVGAKAMGAAGRARVENHFSEAAMLAGTRVVYEEALTKKPRKRA